MVYDVTDRKGFEAGARWLEWLKDRKASIHGMVGVLANKIDIQEHRVVNMEEGRKLALQYAAPYFEVSAKWGVNIDAALTTMAFYFIRTRDPGAMPNNGPKGAAVASRTPSPSPPSIAAPKSTCCWPCCIAVKQGEKKG